NESVSYFNEFRPLDCFVATLLATTVPKIVPYRERKKSSVDFFYFNVSQDLQKPKVKAKNVFNEGIKIN
ncbi:hypothetical protein, partial [Legionella pneumophila]|uniref:hypothetical protein n=1 Tax=Legionella pneumophila TaxID=446 RepID=UPI001E5C814A